MLLKEEIRNYLQATGKQQEELFQRAREIRDRYVGNHCFIRAVVEVTNNCRINCDYCEMRRSASLYRYDLTVNEILAAASNAVKQGIPTIVLQGGEIPQTTRLLRTVLPELKKKGLSVILCLGNKEPQEYECLRNAGADGYILKLETTNPALHQSLRHDSFLKRLRALYTLRHLGYHVGTGIICGLPGQTLDSLVDDLYFIGQQRWSMCSVSPYIPPTDAHSIRSLAGRPHGSLNMTLNAIAVLRLLQPAAMIPTVSALELVDTGGQVKGLQAGANVITVNFTPQSKRVHYRIYCKDRFIVELDHARQVVQRAGMSVTNAPSLGPVIVPGELLKPFFEEKWSEAAVSFSLDTSVYTFKNPLLEEIIENISDGPICDLGCGDGRYTIPLIKKGKGLIYAVDFSQAALDRLKNRLLHTIGLSSASNVRLELKDIRNIQLDNQFKLIILANVIHYLSPVEVAWLISTLTQYIRPNGGLYIGIETNIQMEYEPQKYFIFSNQYEHSPNAIRRLLIEAGLEPVGQPRESSIEARVILPPTVRHILNTPNVLYTRRFTLCELYAVRRR